jgi:AraC-like DNA-binding protein
VTEKAHFVAKKESQMSTHNHTEIANFDSAAEFFKMLGDGTRIKIFWILCHGEECGSHLAERLGITAPAAAHHLSLLRECGLIVPRREGREVYYRLADSEMGRAMHTAVESVTEIACPEQSGGATVAETVRRAHDYLLEHISERVTIEELSRKFHVNPTTLKKAFKDEYGSSIAAHTREHRMERAEILLREGNMSVSDAARAVGFDSASRFTSAFKEKYGVSPSEYRRQK